MLHLLIHPYKTHRGSVFFGTILGKIFLYENLSLSGWIGVTMISGGIILVAIDPNADLGH